MTPDNAPPPLPGYASPRGVTWHDDGLLWLVNRCLLHRLGYCLEGYPDGTLVLLGDGTEEWVYDGDMPDDGMATLTGAEAAARLTLGNVAVDRALAMAGPQTEDPIRGGGTQ